MKKYGKWDKLSPSQQKYYLRQGILEGLTKVSDIQNKYESGGYLNKFGAGGYSQSNPFIGNRDPQRWNTIVQEVADRIGPNDWFGLYDAAVQNFEPNTLYNVDGEQMTGAQIQEYKQQHPDVVFNDRTKAAQKEAMVQYLAQEAVKAYDNSIGPEVTVTPYGNIDPYAGDDSSNTQYTQEDTWGLGPTWYHGVPASNDGYMTFDPDYVVDPSKRGLELVHFAGPLTGSGEAAPLELGQLQNPINFWMNRLSPTQNIRALWDLGQQSWDAALNGDLSLGTRWDILKNAYNDPTSTLYGNNGIVSDEFAEEHPQLALAANLAGDVVIPAGFDAVRSGAAGRTIAKGAKATGNIAKEMGRAVAYDARNVARIAKEQGQKLADDFWDGWNRFTGGDDGLSPQVQTVSGEGILRNYDLEPIPDNILFAKRGKGKGKGNNRKRNNSNRINSNRNNSNNSKDKSNNTTTESATTEESTTPTTNIEEGAPTTDSYLEERERALREFDRKHSIDFDNTVTDKENLTKTQRFLRGWRDRLGNPAGLPQRGVKFGDPNNKGSLIFPWEKEYWKFNNKRRPTGDARHQYRDRYKEDGKVIYIEDAEGNILKDYKGNPVPLRERVINSTGKVRRAKVRNYTKERYKRQGEPWRKSPYVNPHWKRIRPLVRVSVPIGAYAVLDDMFGNNFPETTLGDMNDSQTREQILQELIDVLPQELTSNDSLNEQQMTNINSLYQNYYYGLPEQLREQFDTDYGVPNTVYEKWNLLPILIDQSNTYYRQAPQQTNNAYGGYINRFDDGGYAVGINAMNTERDRTARNTPPPPNYNYLDISKVGGLSPEQRQYYDFLDSYITDRMLTPQQYQYDINTLPDDGTFYFADDPSKRYTGAQIKDLKSKGQRMHMNYEEDLNKRYNVANYLKEAQRAWESMNIPTLDEVTVTAKRNPNGSEHTNDISSTYKGYEVQPTLDTGYLTQDLNPDGTPRSEFAQAVRGYNGYYGNPDYYHGDFTQDFMNTIGMQAPMNAMIPTNLWGMLSRTAHEGLSALNPFDMNSAWYHNDGFVGSIFPEWAAENPNKAALIDMGIDIAPLGVHGVKGGYKAGKRLVERTKPYRNYRVAKELNRSAQNWDGTVGQEYFNAPDRWYRKTQYPEVAGIREQGRNVTTIDLGDYPNSANNFREFALGRLTPGKGVNEGYWIYPEKFRNAARNKLLKEAEGKSKKRLYDFSDAELFSKSGSAHGNRTQGAWGRPWEGSTSMSEGFPEYMLEGVPLEDGTMPAGRGANRSAFNYVPIEEIPKGHRIGFKTGEMPMRELRAFRKLDNGRYKYEGEVIPEHRITLGENSLAEKEGLDSNQADGFRAREGKNAKEKRFLYKLSDEQMENGKNEFFEKNKSLFGFNTTIETSLDDLMKHINNDPFGRQEHARKEMGSKYNALREAVKKEIMNKDIFLPESKAYKKADEAVNNLLIDINNHHPLVQKGQMSIAAVSNNKTLETFYKQALEEQPIAKTNNLKQIANEFYTSEIQDRLKNVIKKENPSLPNSQIDLLVLDDVFRDDIFKNLAPLEQKNFLRVFGKSVNGVHHSSTGINIVKAHVPNQGRTVIHEAVSHGTDAIIRELAGKYIDKLNKILKDYGIDPKKVVWEDFRASMNETRYDFKQKGIDVKELDADQIYDAFKNKNYYTYSIDKTLSPDPELLQKFKNELMNLIKADDAPIVGGIVATGAAAASALNNNNEHSYGGYLNNYLL